MDDAESKHLSAHHFSTIGYLNHLLHAGFFAPKNQIFIEV